jgi:FtsH-binding integral membrane protein
MTEYSNLHSSAGMVGESARVDESTFLRQTYFHLFGAVVAFLAIEFVLFQTGIAQALAPVMASNWLIVIGGFMVLGFVTSYFTRRESSPSMQYVEMAITITLQAIIFIPLLVYAVYFTDVSVLSSALGVTLIIFASMTAIVAYTGKSFTFLGPFLAVLGIAALIAIVGSVIFSVSLGFYFSLAMVVFAAGVVLYETSKVAHDYGPGQHISAATGLFASVALLFYYVLSTFISRE